MIIKISKKRVKSSLRDTQFYEVVVDFDLTADESLFSKYFDEDFVITLHVDGARERGHTLTASRPVTKLKIDLKSAEGLDLLFAHKSDANMFVERLKEQVGKIMELLRSKADEESGFDEDFEIEV